MKLSVRESQGLLRKALFLLVFNFGCATLADPTFWQTHVEPTFQRAGDSTSLALWLSGTASVLTMRDHDNELRDQWKDHQKMSAADAKIGDRYLSYGVNIGMAGLQYWLDRENGVSHLRALAFTGVTTWTFKGLAGRERPNQANHHSFPSGHTSSAFATATSLSYAYGWKAGVPAFAMATWSGLSRMADDDHWASDVVAGAFLGVIWGRAGFFSAGKQETTWIWTPMWSSQGAGVQASLAY